MLSSTSSRLKTTLRNFPESLFFIFLTVLLVILEDITPIRKNFDLHKLIHLFFFPATLLLTGIRLKYSENSKSFFISCLMAITFLFLMTFFLSNNFSLESHFFYTAGIFFFSISLPFLKNMNEKKDSLSLFASKLLLSSLTAFLLGFTLYMALIGLMLGVSSLFNVSSFFNYILEVVVVTFYAYPMIFVLSTLKQDLSGNHSLPKVLPYFFTSLLPYVVLAYGLVLYVYFFKVMWNFELPKGKITYLGFSFAVAGIIFHFFASPFISKAPPFIKKFHNRFYWTLIIPLFMMSVALFRRLYDYGLTESRYHAIIGTVILIGITTSALLLKSFSYRKIFFYVGIILTLTAYGPLSENAFSKYFHQPEPFFKELSK